MDKTNVDLALWGVGGKQGHLQSDKAKQSEASVGPVEASLAGSGISDPCLPFLGATNIACQQVRSRTCGEDCCKRFS